jgi:hypothetical protein
MMGSYYLTIIALLSPALERVQNVERQSVYESQDGNTLLIVSGNYYYLGPRNHPNEGDFVKKYGQAGQYLPVGGGRCFSFGVFKLALFKRASSVCQNVKIRKSVARVSNATYYEATCFELKGSGCSSVSGAGRPALTYAYKAESGRGITVIYLSDRHSRDRSNTLVLKSGKALLGS